MGRPLKNKYQQKVAKIDFYWKSSIAHILELNKLELWSRSYKLIF
jgi:hypothetical protein